MTSATSTSTAASTAVTIVLVASRATAAKASLLVASTTMVATLETVMAEMEEEGKEFHFFKQDGVVLEIENKLFLGRKEGDPKFLRKEVKWLFFGGIISFSGRIIKVGGLNLMITRTFS